MAPTDPSSHAPPVTEHRAVAVAGPDSTYGVECGALDFFPPDSFPTADAARKSDVITAHVAEKQSS